MTKPTMKKLLCFLAILSLLALSACSADPVQEDLMTYVNEDLMSIFELEAEAVDSYSSVSGNNYTDDWTMYETMDAVTIPAYTEFIEKLESIRPETKEVRAVHEIYIDASNTQFRAMKMILIALELQSYDKILEANELLDEGRTKLRQFQDELEELMEEHEVEWEEEIL